VVSISGAPGVGKSALAVHIAYQVRDEFPDGQLYAHLRGSDAVPVPPEQVLNQFLRALGVAPTTLSGDLEELAARFRGRLADRRILIILDDAASAGQVRPLIPGDAHCALVVTSRSRLPGLAGAYRRSLEVLDPAASLALLSRVIGEPRVRAEPDATLALAEACGHLPLAMQVAAAKLSSKDHWRVAQMVSRLGDERRRLDELTLDDFGVRPSLSISYRALPPLSARLLMLLSSLGATEFGGWVAAPLLETEVAEAADVLEELVEARLVEVQTGAGYQARYRLHDLTRIFAGERLARDVAAAERAAAQHRLLRCWLFLVYQAHRREFGGDYLVLHSDVPPWPLPSNLVDALQSDPMLWLQSEYPSLVSAVSLAAQLRQDDLCWDLAVTSVMLFETRAYFQAWRETHEVAMEAVRRAGNRRGEAVLRYSRGGLALAEMRLVDAQHEFKRAFEWFAEVGDARGRGLTLRDLASIDRMQGRYDEAQARSEQALADLGSVRDRAAQAHVLRNLAQIHLECDRADEAELRLREALAICAEIGVRRVEAQVRYRLGQVLLAKGEPPAAAEAFRQVLSVAEHSNDVAGRANALLGIGTVHVALDELNRAETALGDALVAARNGGSRLAEGQILLALAEVFRRRGDRPAAAAELDSAAAIFLQIGAPAWRARADEAKRLLANGAIAGR
jgi:tetratricopeptide (TPR) repeat protein